MLLRPAVRYQARLMGRLTIGDPLDFVWVESLLDKYKLLEINIPTATSDAETERIGELGMQLGQCEDYFDTIEPMAQALAGGLSLEGAGEALSIGAAAAYLSTSYGTRWTRTCTRDPPIAATCCDRKASVSETRS